LTGKNRRTLRHIERYLEPKEIFILITTRQYPYIMVDNLDYYLKRDRALMAMAYCSAGRISEIVPGYRYKTVEGKPKAIRVGRHSGLLRENIEIREDHILIRGMKVVKRSERVIRKHGHSVITRSDFVIPLEPGMFENPYWDQLVPFGYLILDYLESYAPKSGPIFPITSVRAWQIINKVTGKWSHWFRAQAEHFYGNFLLTDTIKLSKFVKVVDPKSVAPYIGYDWREQLKDKEFGMDFAWIRDFLRKRKKYIQYSTLK